MRFPSIGACATFLLYPLDLLKTRMQVNRTVSSSWIKPFVKTVQDVYTREGTVSLSVLQENDPELSVEYSRFEGILSGNHARPHRLRRLLGLLLFAI